MPEEHSRYQCHAEQRSGGGGKGGKGGVGRYFMASGHAGQDGEPGPGGKGGAGSKPAVSSDNIPSWRGWLTRIIPTWLGKIWSEDQNGHEYNRFGGGKGGKGGVGYNNIPSGHDGEDGETGPGGKGGAGGKPAVTYEDHGRWGGGKGGQGGVGGWGVPSGHAGEDGEPGPGGKGGAGGRPAISSDIAPFYRRWFVDPFFNGYTRLIQWIGIGQQNKKIENQDQKANEKEDDFTSATENDKCNEDKEASGHASRSSEGGKL